MSRHIFRKFKAYAPLACTLQLCALQAQAAPGELSTQPLTFVISPQPNIMLLLDDSGSMNIERLISDGGQTVFSTGVDGRSFSDPDRNRAEDDDDIYELCAGYNSLAYNPEVKYDPWVSVSDPTDTNYIFGNKTLATALDDPIDPIGVVNLSDHFYIAWDDQAEGVDGHGVFEDGECGGGAVQYDTSTEETTQTEFPVNSNSITVSTTSGTLVDSGGAGGNYTSGVAGNGTVLINITDPNTGTTNDTITFSVTAFNVDRFAGDSDSLTIYGGSNISSPITNAVRVTEVFAGSGAHPDWSSLDLNVPGDSLSIFADTSGNTSQTRFDGIIAKGQVSKFTVNGSVATLVFDAGTNGFNRSGFIITWEHSDHVPVPIVGNGDGVVTEVDCVGSTSNCKLVSELPENTLDPNYDASTHGYNTQQNYANWYTYHRSRDFVAKNALANIISISDHRIGFATTNDRGDGGAIIRDMSQISDSYDSSTGVHEDKDTLLKRLYQANTFTNKQLKDESGNVIVNPEGQNQGTPLRRLLNNTGLYFQEGKVPSATYLGYDITNTTLRRVSHSDEVVSDTDSNLRVVDEFTPQFTTAYGGQCQQNFALLVTDGSWNGSLSASEQPGNTDADDTAPGADYDGGNYADAYSNTLADVAMKYFETDLSTTLEDRLSVSLHNQTIEHQHMVTFGIGFGVTGSIEDDPETTSVTWTDPINNDGNQRVDDLLHASYNGRGGYFSASDPDSLQENLDAIIQEINVRTENSATGVSFSSYQLNDGTLRYDVSYRTETWWGDIEAYKFENGAFSTTAEWSADTILSAKTDAERRSRNIISFNGQKGIVFAAPADHDNLDANTEISVTQRDDLLSLTSSLDTAAEATYLGNIINYLKGDSTNEGTFRERSDHYLGALIHSQPQYVAAPEQPYPFDIEGDTNDTSYAVFADTYKYRRPIVYVGGNDGMLHAFYASNEYQDGSGTDTSDTQGGEELFAYVPHMISDEDSGGRGLSATANTVYQNTPYVDGDIIVSDVFVNKKNDTTSRWRTYLVGALRAGGRGIYALDITNPDGTIGSTSHPNLSNATDSGVADEIVVREFTHDDLGYVYGSPIIAKMNNDRWAAIVPSGYWSTGTTDTISGDGTAKLFIVYLDALGANAATDADSYTVIQASENVFPATACTPSTTTRCSLNEHRYVRASYTKNGLSSDIEVRGSVQSSDFFCSTDTFGTISGYTLQGCYISETDINGLSAPTVVDLDNDGDADRVYAGDLHGNMWVFNVQDSSESNWAVDDNSSTSNEPMFTACRSDISTSADTCPEADRQPIMVAPLIISHPEQLVSLDTANTLVLFGTGQYVTEDDQQHSAVQSIYGVWDAGKTRRNIQRKNLTAQTFTNVIEENEIIGRTGTTISVTYNNEDPSSSSAVFGWRLDLPPSNDLDGTANDEYRERSIISPIDISRFLVFATFIPTEGQCNASSGTSFLNAVQLVDGQAADIFDQTDSQGNALAGFRVDGAIVGIDHLRDSDGNDKVGVSTDAKENFIYDTDFTNNIISGRQSWSILR